MTDLLISAGVSILLLIVVYKNRRIDSIFLPFHLTVNALFYTVSVLLSVILIGLIRTAAGLPSFPEKKEAVLYFFLLGKLAAAGLIILSVRLENRVKRAEKWWNHICEGQPRLIIWLILPVLCGMGMLIYLAAATNTGGIDAALFGVFFVLCLVSVWHFVRSAETSVYNSQIRFLQSSLNQISNVKKEQENWLHDQLHLFNDLVNQPGLATQPFLKEKIEAAAQKTSHLLATLQADSSLVAALIHSKKKIMDDNGIHLYEDLHPLPEFDNESGPFLLLVDQILSYCIKESLNSEIPDPVISVRQITDEGRYSFCFSFFTLSSILPNEEDFRIPPDCELSASLSDNRMCLTLNFSI